MPAGYERRVYLGDVNAATPAWYDISDNTDPWDGEFSESADNPASAQFLVRQKGRGGALLPVQPTVGMEVVYYLHHLTNPLLHKYKFGGTIATPPPEPDDVNALRHKWMLQCIDFTEELYQMVPYISFVAPAQATDVDRVWHLMNGAFPTKWDFTTQLAGFPGAGEVSFPAGEVQGFYREPVIDILNHLAADVGRDTDPNYPVAWRRWHISVQWADPANPGQGAPDDSYALQRVLHYYSGSSLPLSSTKLKDVPDGAHAYYGHDYKIAEDGSQLFNIISIAGPDADPAGVQWDNEVGATGRAADITKTTPGNPEAWDAGAGSVQKITEDGGRLTMAMEETLLGADSFDGPPLPEGNRTAEVGGQWLLGGSDDTWIATANGYAYGACLIDPPANRKAFWTLDTKASNCIVQMDVDVAEFGTRLVFRYVDDENFWSLENNTTSYVLKKRLANSETIVHTYSEVAANEDRIKVSLEGDDINFYLGRNYADPVFVHTFTSADLNYATRHGIGFNLASGVGVAKINNFRCWHIYSRRAFGLGTTDAATDVADIEYAWLFKEDRTAQVAEGGVLKGSPVTYTYGDTYEVEVRRNPATRGDGTMAVKYYRTPAAGGRTLIHTSTSIPDPTEAAPMYANAAFFHNGSSLTNVLFRRFTFSTHRDPTSIGLYGPHERKGVLKDASLENWTMREERAQALFHRYAYPRVTMTCTTQTEFPVGTRIQVSNSRMDPPWVDRQLVLRKVTPNYRAAGNKQDPVYQLELGESIREYGDDEPIGILLRGPRRIEAPDPPTGLEVGAGQRDGPATVRQSFALDPVPSNTRYIQLQLVRPDDSAGGQRPIDTYPPDATQFQIPGLAPQQSAQVKARTVDQNGVPSDWTAVKTFTTAEIEDTPPALQTETQQTAFVDAEGLGRQIYAYDAANDRLDVYTNPIPSQANGVRFRALNAGSYHWFAEGPVAVGDTALANSATRGHFYIPSTAGVPTGVPVTFGAAKAVVWDSTNDDLYLYDGGWINLSGGGGGGHRTLMWTADYGASAIATGQLNAQEVPITGTIVAVRAFGRPSGSVTFKLRRATYSALPTFTNLHATAFSISSSDKGEDTTLSGYTTSLTAGDWLDVDILSLTTFTQLSIAVRVAP